MFKKFFKGIVTKAKKIYNSRQFEFAGFVLTSINTTVDWVSSTKEFVNQLKLVGATLKIIGKFLLKTIMSWTGKAKSAVIKAAA